MPEETTTTELPSSAAPDATGPQTKEGSEPADQHNGSAPVSTDEPSNPAPSESKANGKIDEFEVPADIQAWPDEKPVINKEDEDRLLKV